MERVPGLECNLGLSKQVKYVAANLRRDTQIRTSYVCNNVLVVHSPTSMKMPSDLFQPIFIAITIQPHFCDLIYKWNRTSRTLSQVWGALHTWL